MKVGTVEIVLDGGEIGVAVAEVLELPPIEVWLPEPDEWIAVVLLDGHGRRPPVALRGSFVPELAGMMVAEMVVGIEVAWEVGMIEVAVEFEMEVADEVESEVELLEITPVPVGVLYVDVDVETVMLLLGVAVGTQLGRVKVPELPDEP